MHTNDTQVITSTLAKGFNTSGYINIEKQFRPLMAQLFMNKPPYPQVLVHSHAITFNMNSVTPNPVDFRTLLRTHRIKIAFSWTVQ